MQKEIVLKKPEHLKPNPLSKKIFGDLKSDEYNNLKKDIQNRGIQDPLHITTDNIIISGHQRHKIANEINIDLPCIIRDDLTEKWQIEEQLIADNLLRRHLSDYQKVECGERLQDIESKKAKKRQKETLPKKGEKGFNAVENLPPHNKGKSRDKVAEKIGMSGRQYDKARKIYHEAPDTIKQQWKNGKISTHKAYKTIKTHEKQKQIQKQNKPTKNMPKDIYSVIYADPPWRYNFSKTINREIENQYPTMTLEEIKNMELPKTTDDAVLYLWATAPKLVEALEVMKTWGFTYKTHAIWDKQQIGMGYWFRNQHELLLVGTKGNFSPPSEKNRASSIFKHKRGKHSKKPDEIRTLINKWFPDAKKIELFARQKTKNWDIWGTTNED